MSYSTTKVQGAKENLVAYVPARGDTTISANATPETAVSGTSNLPHTLYGATLDCSDNPNDDVTLRIYDDASAPTVGTDHALVWAPGNRGKKDNEYEWPAGIPFANGISLAVVKGDGGTGGNENPSGKVRVTLRINDGS